MERKSNSVLAPKISTLNSKSFGHSEISKMITTKQGRIHEPKSRAGGQERRKKLSVTNRLKSAKKAKCDRQTNRWTEWVIESRARD